MIHATKPPPSRRYRGRPSRRGAVLIVMITAITLLVGLVFFVINLGDQVNRRLSLQNAADAAAISGAGWMARSMNVIASNNVTQVRLISLIAVLDSLPLAAEMTIAEQSQLNRLAEGLERYETVGPSFTPYERENFYREGLSDLFERLDETQLELLEKIDEAFDQDNEILQEGGYDIARTTEWNGPNGRGYLWRACLALDYFSQAEVDTAGLFAQADAQRYAEPSGAQTGFVLPLLPVLPVVRTSFLDFGPTIDSHFRYGRDRNTGRVIEEQKTSGLVSSLRNSADTAQTARELRIRGGGIPDGDIPYRMGPFARLYRWRDYWDQWDWNGASWDYAERWGYTTFGPLEHHLRRVQEGFGLPGGYYWGWGHWWHAHHGDGIVDVTRFAFHLRTLAMVKVAYMLTLPSPIRVQYSDEWISDYEKAVERVGEDREAQSEAKDNGGSLNSVVMMTRYYEVHVRSTRNPDSREWMTWDERPPTPLTPEDAAPVFTPARWWSWELGSRDPWGEVTRKRLHMWIKDRKGWVPTNGAMPYADVKKQGWSACPMKKWLEMDDSGQAWFRKTVNEKVIEDSYLGLPPRIIGYEDKEQTIPIYEYYTVYTAVWRVFGGIEMRNEIELTSPIAGASLDDLPAPMLLSPRPKDGWVYEPDPNEGLRREQFMYLGIARRNATGRAMSERFTPGNPSGYIVAVAQAEVFNNKSWDLWTQDWRAQLVPVRRWDEWVERFDADLSEIGDADLSDTTLDSDDLQEILEYMEAISSEMAESNLHH